jgi:16S rRNA (guanine527-N7)-methyltransferase
MSSELRDLVQAFWPDLESEALERVLLFHKILAEENERQNLTRLISPKDFLEGHLWDVRELLNSKTVEFPAMDLGSGCGVPGLLTAAVGGGAWLLAESERHKADFLFRAVRELGLGGVRIVADRGESFLSDNAVQSVVARAVGPVERIYGWLHACSTWNNLVLLKGPAWKTEWESLAKTKYRGDLRVAKLHEYAVGAENKQRVIVKLSRVPRGT